MLINCVEIAKKIKTEISKTIKDKKISPVLIVVQVGDNPASSRYVKYKKLDCEEVGIKCVHEKMPYETTELELIEYINSLDESCYDGIIVQLPLPSHIDKNKIINAIKKEKDVDGFRRDSDFISCTPGGIMKVLERFDLDGKDCLIINRSDIVGKPLVNLLLDKNATVTIAHSHTKGLERKIQKSDVIISGVGIPDFIKPELMSHNKIFIDVSINFDAEGKICGDLNPECYMNKYRNCFITPVPKGIGLMTRAMLLQNVLDSCLKRGY